MRVDVNTRNGWLRLDDEGLGSQCELRRFKSGGPGGQRRNKVQTGVQLAHGPSGLDAQASESRSAEANRTRALRRLRERIAAQYRSDRPETPAPEIERNRSAGGRLLLNPRNRAFPLVAATVLDALSLSGGSFAGAARLVGLTTSQVVKLLRSEPWLWRAARSMMK